MKEKPIIFNGEMVRAILDDRKWQTRRVVKITHKTPGLAACLEPPEWAEPRPKVAAELCPYGQTGDRLYVKETHAIEDSIDRVVYQADMAAQHFDLSSQPFQQKGDMFWLESGYAPLRWRSSRFMPRWASRVTLEITGVRVERVQDITPTDALAEGVADSPGGMWSATEGQAATSPQAAFALLWNSINAKRGYGWDANPWVWVIEFRGVES